MPTIEIVSVESKTLELNQNHFGLTIRMEKVLKSHRGLFQDFLQKQSGTIVHLGNPDMKFDGTFFFAGKLLDPDFENADIILPEVKANDPKNNWGANQSFNFKFKDEYKREVDIILKLAIDNSPIHKVYFLTDFQFGPEKANQEIIYSIHELWERHDAGGLEFNKLYEFYSY